MTNQPKSPEDSVRPARASRWRRLLWLAAGGVLVLGLAGLYLHFTYGHSIGSGPAGPKLTAADFGRGWSAREVLLVGLGDSVTAGFGARRGYGYFDRLVRNPEEDAADLRGISLSAVLPHLKSTNLAISGSISHEVATFQIPGIPTVGSNVQGWVVITTGGNDLIHNYGKTPPREQAMYGASWEQAQPWVQGFERRLQTIVSEVEKKFPGGCHIFLANIYDPSDGAGDIDKAGLPPWPDGLKLLDAYNEVIRRCGEQHRNVHLVDMHGLFLGHGLHCAQFWSKHYDAGDPHYWYYTNLEDPNERGYDALRRLFLIEMAKVAKNLTNDQ